MMGLVAVDASANPFSYPERGNQRSAEFRKAPDNFLPGNVRARTGSREAANQAKQRYPDSKILSINPVRNNDRQYRIKLLSNDGVVKYVFVDATSGEVFDE
tara:strand:- start:68107 stop:68409 length:303 start_codon:yes stop_codon:yes gene_type:complete